MKLLNRYLFIVFIVFLPLILALAITPLHAKQTDALYSKQIQSFDNLPQGLAYAISSTLQDKLPSTYSLDRAQSGFLAKNPAHGMNFTFTDKGPRLTNNNNTWRWSMTLTRWGRSKSLMKAPLATLTAKGPRIEYKRGASLSEWYMNTPWGLEQGFTVNNKPSTPKDLPSSLILELTLSGTLQPALQGNTLLLSDSTGQTCIRYTGLYAFDTEGKTLPSRLALKGDTLRILIDDSMASYPITIDPWVQTAKLTASDGAANDRFGISVSISGDTVVVGAYGDDSFKGSAYVFEKSGSEWTQTAKLTASDGAASDYFGFSVSIDGDTVVAGAYSDTIGSNYHQGSAYVFEKPGGGWADMTQTAKLTASDGAWGDYFGRSVSISGNKVVVGASYDDDNGIDSGSAYVFTKPGGGWADMTQAYKLTASDGMASDDFGRSVSIDGDTVVVGAYCDDDNGIDSGSAYIFFYRYIPWLGIYDWVQTAKLTASDGAAYDYFGFPVSISGDTVVVGAHLDDIGSNNAQGSAYVFEKPGGGWTDMTQTAKLLASDGAASDYFGHSVSISGNKVVVGAYLDDIGSNNFQGSAYVFEKPGGGWADMTQTAKLTASDGAAYDYFGSSVSIGGDTVVVGAYRDDSYKGSAYVFKLTQNLAPVLMLLLEDSGG